MNKRKIKAAQLKRARYYKSWEYQHLKWWLKPAEEQRRILAKVGEAMTEGIRLGISRMSKMMKSIERIDINIKR